MEQAAPLPGDGVRLGADSAARLSVLADRVRAVAAVVDDQADEPDLRCALEFARDLGGSLPAPARGDTVSLWESLATLGATDLTVARVVEPHLDALAILGEARREGHPLTAELPDDAVLGVFAAEGGPRLLATRSASGWTLSGTKPWCSLADQVSHALVTAWVDERKRGLFVVDLGDPGVQSTGSDEWVARGLTRVRSTGLELTEVPGDPVGGPGWYLDRPGFAWGGIGVAAIWYGGAVSVARRMREGALRREPDQIGLAHLGAVDAALTRARLALLDAAGTADGPMVGAEVAGRLALRVRQLVADTVEEILVRAGHALGPGPLAVEEAHARRVADLGLYVRQHHAERDAAALGRSALTDAAEGEWSWW